MTAAHTDQPITLTVEPRDERTASVLRVDKLVPLELYGEGFTNAHVMAEARTVAAMLREHGTTTLIDLTVGKDTPVKVLFREPQYHPVSHDLLHLDLFKVNLKEKITADIPLVFVGVSAAVEDLDGTMITSKDTVEVECLPSDLPHEIEVDIAKLATFDDALHVSDIVVPAGVTILDEPDETLASVTEPRSEEELAALNEAVEEDLESVEVEEKGKDEEAADEEGDSEPPESKDSE